jgi:lipopolysaccharide transport system permease protein
MLSKIYFPRLLLPLSTAGSALLDFGVALVVQFVLLLAYGINPGWRVLTLPVWVALLLVMALGCGMVASALTVRYRDVGYVIPLLLQLLLFASPVAYPLDAVPDSVRWFVALNPLTGLLQAFHWCLTGYGSLPPSYLAYSAVTAVMVTVIGALVFSSLERSFADVI